MASDPTRAALAERLTDYADSDRWRAHDGRFRLDLRIAADALEMHENERIGYEQAIDSLGKRVERAEAERDAARLAQCECAAVASEAQDALHAVHAEARRVLGENDVLLGSGCNAAQPDAIRALVAGRDALR